MRELAERMCKLAKDKGAEFAEVYISKERALSVKIEKQGIKATDAKRDDGIALRTFIKGGMGFCSRMGLDGEIEGMVDDAVAMARRVEKDPDFRGLPSPEPYPEVSGLYDERIAQMESEELVEIAKRVIEEAKGVREDVIIDGEVEASSVDIYLSNSQGVSLGYKKTFIYLGGSCIIREPGDNVGSFYDFKQARQLKDFKIDGLLKETTKKAESFLNARKVETKTLPIILGPLATYSFLRAFGGCLNAEDIQRQRSPFVGKKGKKIGNGVITLTDDPLIPGGIFSSRVDAEGTPRKRLLLYKDGIIQTYLHNSYTSAKAKEENTGHAIRRDYRTRVYIAPSNIIPSLGKRKGEEIIADTKEGIYIFWGSFRPNPNGDISTTIDFGYKIENGELAYPIKNTMLGTTIFHLLQNITDISSDYREEPGLILPTIRIEGVRISGGR